MKRAYKTTYRTTYKSAHLGSKLNAYEPELTTYMDGLTTPLSSERMIKINDFIKELKKGLNIDALSDAFDIIRLYGNDTAEAALRNLVSRTNDATAVNSPVFTASAGFKSNGTSSYIEENINLNDASNYSKDSASIITYINSFSSGIDNFILGVYSTAETGGANNVVRLCSSRSSNNTILYFDINNSISSLILLQHDSDYYATTRNNSTEKEYYKGASRQVESSSSTNIPDQNLVSLARRTTDGSVGLFGTHEISFLAIGRWFSEAEMTVIRNAFNNFFLTDNESTIGIYE